MWEVMSRGAQPFGSRELDEIYSCISHATSLDKPVRCPDFLYDIMLRCWKKNPADRPHFHDIGNVLQTITKPFMLFHVGHKLEDPLQQPDKLPIVESSNLTFMRAAPYTGMFGSIIHAVYTYQNIESNGRTMEVALKTNAVPEINSITFMHEAIILSKLHHDNIIALVGIVSDFAFSLIMTEFADFGSISNLLTGERVLLLTHVWDLMKQTLQGMAYLRSRRIVHRNFKAANILLNSDYHVKIANFEWSAEINEGEECCEFTESWMSLRWTAPECLKTEKFYFKSDV